MKQPRYILEPYKGLNTRYTCPACNYKRQFTRFIDTETGEHLPDQYGRCNREDKCTYFLSPFADGYSQRMYRADKPIALKSKQAKTRQVSYIDCNLLTRSLQEYDRNNFVQFLLNTFGAEKTQEVISKYNIGTSSHWQGANVFWQVDKKGKVRGGKIMLYSPVTGNRIKEPYNHITWVHKALKCSDYNLQQCFFGEHLLNDKANPVAIVEAEKTAVIASIFLPECIWMAAGSKNGLTHEKCQSLKDRKVIFFPDAGCYGKWKEQAERLSIIANFITSDLIEKNATPEERREGFDIADYLIRITKNRRVN